MSESSADEALEYGKPTDPAWRDVPAEDSPVPAGPATLPAWPMGVRSEPGPDRLVLRPTYGGMGPAAIRFSAVAFLLVPAVLLFVAVFLGNWAAQATIAALVILAYAVFAVFAAWHRYHRILLPRVAFDREAETLTLGWRGRRGRRPLSSVIGVQVMQTRKQFGLPDQNVPAVTMYQMNLILDDPVERRLNILTSSLEAARSNARLVADFVGVPVLDNVAALVAAKALQTDAVVRGKSLGAPAAADVSMPADWAWLIASPMAAEAGPDVRVIRPHRLAFLFGVQGKVLASLTTTILFLVLLVVENAPAWFIVVFVACVVFYLLMLLKTLGRQARFDRERGTLTLRRVGRGGQLGRRATLPLASVKAVETAKVGYAADYYLLSLLLDDPQQPRLNLSMDADAAVVRRAAARAASFLGVPLLGAQRPTSAASRPGAGKAAANPLELLSRSPLRPGMASIRGPARVVPKGEDVLVLRPRSRLAWVWLVLALHTIGFELYLVWLAWFVPAAAAGFRWMTMMLLLGALLSQAAALKPLLLYRDHFDRRAGLLTLGWFGLKGTYPLAKVRAVQLIPGGLVDKTAGLRRGGERVVYQMNLVIADDYQERLHLTDDSDLQWTRQAGRQIADFLGAPLIDQIADGD